MATCKHLYKSLNKSEWDIDRSLRRFVNNPVQFRDQLAFSDALISGSFALQFFERVVWHGTGLDIFVQGGIKAESLGQYLCVQQVYEMGEPVLATHWRNIADEVQIRTYTRPNLGHLPDKVQIFQTKHAPLRSILLSSYTTALVNIITPRAAFSIFPLLTFGRYEAFMLVQLDDYYGEIMLKYSKRGWITRDILWEDEQRPHLPIQKNRYVGDEFTWTVYFETIHLTAPKPPDYVMRLSYFGMERRDDLIYGQYYEVTALRFCSCVLRHEYIMNKVSNYFWTNYIIDRLNRLTFLEFMKLKEEDRPTEFIQYTEAARMSPKWHKERDVFNFPDTWTYFDDYLLEWWAAWHDDPAERSSDRLEGGWKKVQ